MSDENDSWLAGIGVDVPSILGGVQDAASAVVDAAGSVASSAYDTASSAASSVADAAGSVYDATSSAAAGTYEAVSGAASEVYDAASSGASAAYDAGGAAYDAVSSTASSAYEAASDAASEAYDAASEAYGEAVDAVSNAFEEVSDAVLDEVPIPLDTSNTAQEEPTLTRDPAVPFDVTADSAAEFFQKAANKMGGHTVGHLEIVGQITSNPDTDGNNRITKANVKAESKIMRPRWAGGRPKAGFSTEAVLKKAEQVVLQHEMKHRKILEDHMRNAVKTLKGKPGTQFNDLWNTIIANYEKAQKELDAKEGQAKVIVNSAGIETDVVAAPLTP